MFSTNTRSSRLRHLTTKTCNFSLPYASERPVTHASATSCYGKQRSSSNKPLHCVTRPQPLRELRPQRLSLQGRNCASRHRPVQHLPHRGSQAGSGAAQVKAAKQHGAPLRLAHTSHMVRVRYIQGRGAYGVREPRRKRTGTLTDPHGCGEGKSQISVSSHLIHARCLCKGPQGTVHLRGSFFSLMLYEAAHIDVKMGALSLHIVSFISTAQSASYPPPTTFFV